jgi:hypothetical protein
MALLCDCALFFAIPAADYYCIKRIDCDASLVPKFHSEEYPPWSRPTKLATRVLRVVEYGVERGAFQDSSVIDDCHGRDDEPSKAALNFTTVLFF